MSHVMRKPVYAICEQQRRRSAHSFSLISVFVIRYLDSIIPLVSISIISSLYLASLAVLASLSLTWSRTPKTGLLVTWLRLLSLYLGVMGRLRILIVALPGFFIYLLAIVQ